MKIFRLNFILFALICSSFLIQSIQAQEVNKNTASPTNAPDSSQKFHLFFEKVFVHTDRQNYASGEDIWFKAYLVNQNNWLTNTSNNLYVDLISSEAKVLDHEVIRMENGTGNGDFKLGDSIPDGKYTIRAYTNWMRNFGDCFIFKKEIEVTSLNGIHPKLEKIKPDTFNGDIRFFPEGGSLIEDVPGIIAFKAIDKKGNGCAVNGKIISSKGETLCWFSSIYLGMGEISFTPEKGEHYYAEGTFPDKTPFRTQLPDALPEGFSMIRVSSHDTSSLIVQISTNHPTFDQYNGKDMLLVGQSNGKNYFTDQIKISKPSTYFKISKAIFPEGIACITLFDEKLRPHCERLVYIKKKEQAHISVTSNRKNYQPRELVVLKIKATDSQNNPLKANLSLAVTDSKQVPQETSNIVSSLKLESEIRGKIEKASSYFDTTNANRDKELDLLLLTQGWRDFVWKRLADTTIRINYMVEPGITVTGRVREKFIDKPMPGIHVSMLLLGNKKDKEARLVLTDAKGRYYFDGLNFKGSRDIILSSKNSKGKDAGWILLDSLFNKPITVNSPLVLRSDTLPPEEENFISEAAKRNNILKKYHLSDVIPLKEVVVRGRKNNFFHNQMVNDLSDLDVDFPIHPQDSSYYSLKYYLLNKIPGAMPNLKNDGIVIPSKISSGYYPPMLDIEGIDWHFIDKNQVYNLSMKDITALTMSHKMMISGMNQHDFYVLYMTIKPGALDKRNFFTINTQVSGYYTARVFYSPKYNQDNEDAEKPDLRTTIYWQPNITTDVNGEAILKFYNADQQTSIRATVEGVTDNGVPVTGTSLYNVKKPQ